MNTSVKRSKYHRPSKRHIRANLGIATSATFKDEVFRLAMNKNKTVSQFVRETLGEMYPTLHKLDEYADYAIKRNPRLRQLQEEKIKREDESISF